MRVLIVAAFALLVAAHAQAQTGPMLEPGESWSLTVTKAGTFGYHCHPHPWMEGELRITDATREPKAHLVAIVEGSSDPDRWTFEPGSLEVMVGDTITWVNNGDSPHQVMFNEDMETGEKHDHGDHDHGDHDPAEEDKALPAPGIVGALLALAWAVRARR